VLSTGLASKQHAEDIFGSPAIISVISWQWSVAGQPLFLASIYPLAGATQPANSSPIA